MRFSTATLSIIATLCASTLASPLIAASKTVASAFENDPWRLSNIVIYESASTNGTNSTRPSSVNFDIKDTNAGLRFNLHCSRTVKKGESLYDAIPRQCGNESLGLSWSLDSSKTVYITRGWVDPAVGPPGMDYVTCFGNWQLNPHPFEVRTPKWSGPLQGTNYTQGCLEVYCTEITA